MIKSLRVAGLLAGASIKRGNIGVILLIIIILTIISLNSLFIPGLLQGLISGANSQLRNTYSSDIIVESSTAQPLLSNVDSLINKIDAIDGVAGAAPINVIGAQFVFGTQRTDADVYSVQPDMENQVFTINKSMIEGTYLSPGDTDQIILGVQLAVCPFVIDRACRRCRERNLWRLLTEKLYGQGDILHRISADGY